MPSKLPESSHVLKNRRQFLISGTKAFVGGAAVLAAGPQVTSGTRRLDELSPQTMVGDIYPENMPGFDVTNAGPAINAACEAARGDPPGRVVLGAPPWNNTVYRFRTIIYVSEGVTLKGYTRSVQLWNDGGQDLVTSFPTRIELKTYARLHTLTLQLAPSPALPVRPDTVGVTTWVPGSTYVDWNWIFACSIIGFPGEGVLLIRARNCVIDGECIIRANGKAGIQVIGGEDSAQRLLTNPSNPDSKPSRIAQNTVDFNGHNGIDLNASNWLIHDNDCNYNGQQRQPADQNGIYVGSVHNIYENNLLNEASYNVVVSNRCYYNFNCGILTSGESGTAQSPVRETGNRYEANYCWNNGNVGIFFQANCPSCNPAVQYNLNEHNVVIYNNCQNNANYGFSQQAGGGVSYDRFESNGACNNGGHPDYNYMYIFPTPDETNWSGCPE